MQEINPRAAGTFCVCVDGGAPDFPLRLYHAYDARPIRLRTLDRILFEMEALFDAVKIPQAAYLTRSFYRPPLSARKEAFAPMSDLDVKNNRGSKATFVVHVQYRQHATWQGTVVWAEENKSRRFRSALELLKLIDSALEEEDAKNPSFFSPGEEID